jgi:hypothetical protein
MIRGIGIQEARVKSAWCFPFGLPAAFPSAVAKAAAFGGCKTCAESSQEQASRDPKRE